MTNIIYLSMILSLENGNDITIEQKYHTHSHFIRIYLKRIAFFVWSSKLKEIKVFKVKAYFKNSNHIILLIFWLQKIIIQVNWIAKGVLTVGSSYSTGMI